MDPAVEHSAADTAASGDAIQATGAHVAGSRRAGLRLWLAGLLLRWVPPFVLNRLRTSVLRACGLRLGRHSIFWGWPRLVGGPPSRLRVGAYCGFNDGCWFELEDEVVLGDHVSVGHEVVFLTGARAGGPARGRIQVGDGAWLAARCVVLPGVTIGAGAVISAAVVVSEDVPPNTLVTGAQKVSLARWR